ncbi:MAG: peptidoglycan bridge formation glycyltransferase FemA/FemB family protein [Bacilli bacterium]|nr:peptidoglycan bridge formation glycyltransferase FemA/FemB family protein [Bacilli bacterium]
MKVVKLDPSTFDKFIISINFCSYYQTAGYGRLLNKFGLQDEYVGFEENGNLVGAMLLFSKPIFMGYKYAYSPRGLIINYNDAQLVSSALKELKSFLNKEHFLLFKMDPLIVCSKRDKHGRILAQNNNINQVLNILKNAGFTHCGFNSYFESVKPRWEAELDLRKSTNQLFKELTKQTRNKLRKATKYGLSIYKDNKYDFASIYHLIQDKDTVNLKYYEEFHRLFGDNLEIYYAKINTKTYVENTKYLYEKELELNDYLTNIIQNNGYKGKNMSAILNKKMESDKLLSSYKKYMVEATQLLRDNPDGLVVGCDIVLKLKNKLFLLVEGYDRRYPNLCSNYLIKWKIIEKYAASNIQAFNMNAIAGVFDPKQNQYRGLNEMKFGYNAVAYEYIGEFNLVVNNAIYSLYKNVKK